MTGDIGASLVRKRVSVRVSVRVFNNVTRHMCVLYRVGVVCDRFHHSNMCSMASHTVTKQRASIVELRMKMANVYEYGWSGAPL